MNIYTATYIVGLLSSTVGAGFALQAQPIVLGNEHRILFGELGSLEGGAVVGRVTDPSAAWYNPGRLAFSNAPSVSGNGALYELATSEISGGGDSISNSNLNTIPSYVGASGRYPGAKDGTRWMWAFGIFLPIAWEMETESRSTVSTFVNSSINPGTYDYSAVGRDTQKYHCYSPTIGTGYKITDTSGIGVSIHFPLNIRSSDSSTHEEIVGRGYYRTYWDKQDQKNYNVRMTIGYSCNIYDAIGFGVTVRSPSVYLSGENKAEYHATSSNYMTGNSQTFDAYVNGGSSRNKSPAEVVIGLSYDKNDWSFETDIMYSAAIGAYQTVEDDLPIRTTLFNTKNGTFTEANSSGTPGTVSYKHIWNVSIGGSYKLTKSLSIHGGFYTDKSPVVDSNEFTDLNIYGTDIGLRYGNEKSCIFMSVYRQVSNTSNAQMWDMHTSQYIMADISVEIIGFSLGASYYL